MMEQEIARVVEEWRAGERVFDSVTTGPNVAFAEMEQDLEEYLAEREGTACVFCKQEPCVWLSN
jgi:mevalonate pyrophosphate decarboxylase